MKKIFLLTTIGALALTSCTHDFGDYDGSINKPSKEEINKNIAEIFGSIDPNQDWHMFSEGSITIFADAPLDNIAKVQVLTESPFFNENARVLNEANAHKGDEVTLTFDAPYDLTRLIAACVDDNGKYYIQAFSIGDKTVSFKRSTAGTRGAAFTRAGADSLSNISLDFKNSFLSYNAERTLSGNGTWKGKNWENDRLWQPTGSGSSNGWTISNSTIYRNATALSAEEEATLQAIFEDALGRYEKNKAKNNLPIIKESSRVRLYDNHLVSTGDAPITLSPIQAASTEAYWCDIYYYYYRTEDIPTGTSEADYVKTLPKFKAIDVNEVRQGISDVTGVAKNQSDTKFLRQYEYLLPFYGNASEFTPQPSTLKTYGYTTDGKFYRIYNNSGNSKAGIDPSDHYITYGDKEHNLKDEGTVNIEYQLWQIFTNANDNSMMLYNVGSGQFLRWDNTDYIEFMNIKDITENSLKNYTIYITDGAKNPYAFDDITKQKVFILSSVKNNFIKALVDKDRLYLFKGGTNISGDYRVAREWTFELYDEHPETAINDAELPLPLFPAGSITPPSAKPSTIIPAGYRIGFMVRKDGGAEANNNNGNNNLKGCVYGYGALNTEINNYGNFKRSVTDFGMDLDSPRMATFTANNKVYLTFEEGTDAQFSDIIVEVGSPGETGADLFDEDLVNVEYMSYMMCFEDSPLADYDLNDAVLRFQRVDETHVKVTVLACGARDELYLRGLTGGIINENTEIHSLFGAELNQFVNTEAGNYTDTYSALFPIDKNTPIWQFMEKVSLYDKTTRTEIKLSEQGEHPCAIIVPGNIGYPLEKVRITDAYPDFKYWVNNATENRDWYKSYEETMIYKKIK